MAMVAGWEVVWWEIWRRLCQLDGGRLWDVGFHLRRALGSAGARCSVGCGKLRGAFVACEVAGVGALSAPLWCVESTPGCARAILHDRLQDGGKCRQGFQGSQLPGERRDDHQAIPPAALLSISINRVFIVNRLYLQRRGNVSITLLASSNLFFYCSIPVHGPSLDASSVPVVVVDRRDTNSISRACSLDGSWAPASSHVEPIRPGARRPARPWRLIRWPSPIIRGGFCCPRRQCSSPVRPVGAEPQSNCECLMSSPSSCLFFVSVVFTSSACLGSSRPACGLAHGALSLRLYAQRVWGSLSRPLRASPSPSIAFYSPEIHKPPCVFLCCLKHHQGTSASVGQLGYFFSSAGGPAICCGLVIGWKVLCV